MDDDEAVATEGGALIRILDAPAAVYGDLDSVVIIHDRAGHGQPAPFKIVADTTEVKAAEVYATVLEASGRYACLTRETVWNYDAVKVIFDGAKIPMSKMLKACQGLRGKACRQECAHEVMILATQLGYCPGSRPINPSGSRASIPVAPGRCGLPLWTNPLPVASIVCGAAAYHCAQGLFLRVSAF